MKEQTLKRGTVLYFENQNIDGIVQIKKGQITFENETTVKHYQAKDTLFLDDLFASSFTKGQYTATQNTVVAIYSKEEILADPEPYFNQLATMFQQEQRHTELLLMSDPLLRLSRYLVYLSDRPSYYLPIPISALLSYLHLSKKELTAAFSHLTREQILSKENRLIKIFSYPRLKEYAFRKSINSYDPI